MIGKHLHTVGLFLASMAAFSVGLGQPRTVFAADAETDIARIQKFIETREGRTVLARAGVSPAQFKLMLGKLTTEQRQSLWSALARITPEARLAARLVAAGYTKAEAEERIALLTQDEVARLADNPEATTGGGAVPSVVAALLVLLAALLVSWYFVAIEDPELERPSPKASPAPPPAE